MSRRVVITGVGPVSAIGIGRDAFAAAVNAGKQGFVREPGPGPMQADGPAWTAPVRDFHVEEFLESPKAYLDRSSQFAFAATALALEDAGLSPSPATGIVLGTAFGSLETMTLFYDGVLEKGPRFAKPFLFPHAYANTAISLLAIEYGLKGHHVSLAAGFTAGAAAIAAAASCIRAGRADVVLAGGYEALSPALLNGCRMAGWTGHGGPECPLPEVGAGVIPGEGAAVLVLEDRDHAAARGARPLAEITGSAFAGHLPGASGYTAAIRGALGETGGADRVFVSANGLPESDRLEREAVAQGGTGGTLVNLKNLVGETFGAGGALQVAAASLALSSPAPRRVLVTCQDPGGSLVALCLRAP